MELSSLANMTSASNRGNSSRNDEGKGTAGAPFADVMRRTGVSDTAQRTSAGDRNATTADPSAPRTSSTETPPRLPQPDHSSPSPTLARQPVTTLDGEPAAGQDANTDAEQILQALETGDMSGLHAVLASLSGDAKAGKSIETASSDDRDADAGPLEAQEIAAILATLPLASTAQPAAAQSTTGATAASGAGKDGQSVLPQVALMVSDGARIGRGLTTDELSDDADPSNSLHQTKASSESAGAGGLLSLFDGNRSGNPGSGRQAVAGQALPAGNIADGLPTGAQGRDPDSANFSSQRPDAGPLAGLSSSLSNATGPTSLSAAPSSMAAAANSGAIASPLHAPQWPAALGQQVLQMHQRGDQQMSLRLHPQELGPLSVSLTVHDQQAQLQILSAHAPVRAAVEAAMPQLRQALADSGIALGEAMVGDQGQFSQGQSPNDDQPRRAPSASGPMLSAQGMDPVDDIPLRQVIVGRDGNINLYA